MAITNHERVGKALEHLNTGLRPFVERELKAKERYRTELGHTSSAQRDVGSLERLLQEDSRTL